MGLYEALEWRLEGESEISPRMDNGSYFTAALN